MARCGRCWVLQAWPSTSGWLANWHLLLPTCHQPRPFTGFPARAVGPQHANLSRSAGLGQVGLPGAVTQVLGWQLPSTVTTVPDGKAARDICRQALQKAASRAPCSGHSGKAAPSGTPRRRTVVPAAPNLVISRQDIDVLVLDTKWKLLDAAQNTSTGK